MKNTAISSLLALAAFLGLQIASQAAPIATLRWEVAPGAPRPASFRLAHGASAMLEAHLLDNRSPLALPEGCEASLHFRTNGMSGWWPTPHEITGAQVATNGIIRARWAAALDAGADEYQLFLRVETSDGADVDYSAFATLTMLESPGFVPNALPLPVQTIDFATVSIRNAPWATPADLAAAIADVAPADYAAVSNAAMSAVQSEHDPTVPSWAKSATPPPTVETDPEWRAWAASNTNAIGLLRHAETAAFANAADLARAADTADVALYAARLGDKAGGSRSAADILGSLDAAASRAFVSNYYEISSLGRIYVPTNGHLYVDGRDSTTNDWESIWSSEDLENDFAALRAKQSALERTVEGAVSSWADYDARGNQNPDADIIMFNRAYVAIGAGFWWATSGGHYCLCSDGQVAYAATGGGSFRLFGSSVSNYVGLVSGQTITVGAKANGFMVSDGIATISYPYNGGDLPIIYGAASLSGPWTAMSSAVWIADANSGVATASFPADQTAFFYKATTTVELGEYFHSTLPYYPEGGIKTSADDITPVVYDSKIVISIDGHRYRIPAELLQ